jgi:hypothetical protein
MIEAFHQGVGLYQDQLKVFIADLKQTEEA